MKPAQFDNQKPKLTDAGADANIDPFTLHPKGSGMVTLHQPEQKSISTNDHLCAMLRQVHDVLACTALPMKRKWVGLTGAEMNHIFAANVGYPERMCHAIETKLRSKNEY